MESPVKLQRLMPKTLQEWNVEFRYRTGNVSAESRSKAGAWIRVVPAREEWDEFLVAVKAEWRNWLRNLGQHDLALLVPPPRLPPPTPQSQIATLLLRICLLPAKQPCLSSAGLHPVAR
jgi:hypothetical protein